MEPFCSQGSSHLTEQGTHVIVELQKNGQYMIQRWSDEYLFLNGQLCKSASHLWSGIASAKEQRVYASPPACIALSHSNFLYHQTFVHNCTILSTQIYDFSSPSFSVFDLH